MISMDFKDLELKHGEEFGLERKGYSRNVVYTYCEPDVKLPEFSMKRRDTIVQKSSPVSTNGELLNRICI
ncbi:hypothetical protein M422DRAFT_267082 [Sphaerobolus stellatus SS14]|uniref:Uncharacterized protein n=1 Tax=Sphaerobolus stellatus (strain SS14) TaxID=990650 RepID=A0A0C9UQC9_SPHS4|nr:hypothetical protein M422DRAFT_267082 [Sphaerobolus stellatus SS14]